MPGFDGLAYITPSSGSMTISGARDRACSYPNETRFLAEVKIAALARTSAVICCAESTPKMVVERTRQRRVNKSLEGRRRTLLYFGAFQTPEQDYQIELRHRRKSVPVAIPGELHHGSAYFAFFITRVPSHMPNTCDTRHAGMLLACSVGGQYGKARGDCQ